MGVFNPDEDMAAHKAAGREAGERIKDMLFSMDSAQPETITLPYDEYNELMRIKASALGYGTPPFTTDNIPKTFGLDIYDTEWEKHEYSQVTEVKMAENGIIIIMAVLEDNERVGPVAAFHPGSWTYWEVVPRDVTEPENGKDDDPNTPDLP